MAKKDKAQKIREEAQKFFGKGKWEKALGAYMKLTKIEPKEPKNLQKVAELQLKLKMKKQAVDTYKGACDLYMSNGFLIQAIAICKMVIQLDPDEKEMEDKLSELYAKRGVGAAPGRGKPAPAPRRPPAAATPRPQPDASTARPRPAAAAPSKPKPAPQPEASAGIAIEPAQDTAGAAVIERTSYEPEEDTIQAESAEAPAYELDDDIAPEIPTDEDEGLPDIPMDDEPELMEADVPIEDEISLDEGIEPESAPAKEEAFSIGDNIDIEPSGAESDEGLDLDMSDGIDDVGTTDDAGIDVGIDDVGTTDDAGIEDDGIEIDVMGDLGDEEDEEEPAAAEGAYDLSADMDTDVSMEDILGDTGDEVVEEAEEAIEAAEVVASPSPPSGDALLNEDDIEDATFFPEIPLFSDLAEDEFREVVRKLQSRSFQKNETIVREGEAGDSIFIVGSGHVEVYKEIEGHEPALMATLQEGEFFGEFGYFSHSKRQASVKALEDVDLLEISRDDLEDVVKRFPGVENVLEKFYRTRVIENLLATSPLFLELDAAHRSEVASSFKLEEYRESDDIVKEGDEGAKMYLIRSGSVSVHTRNPMDEQISLAELGPGEFFGEISLLIGKLRTATVTASSPTVELMSFNKADLEALIDEFPTIGDKLQEVVDARTEDTVNKVSFLDLDEDDLEIGSLV